MEDWIRYAETLEGTDEDGEPYHLLEDYEYDDSPGSLRERTDDLLHRAEASDKLIHEIRDHLINDVLGKTVKEIVDTWGIFPSAGAQRSMGQKVDLMGRKACFIVGCIYGNILRSEKWMDFHQEVFKSVNAVLLAIFAFANKYPHNPKKSRHTTIHFQVKSFLSTFSMWVWFGVFNASDIHDNEPPLTKIPLELLLPTMRRLGMMDVLDEHWNMYGDWDQILDEIARSGNTRLPKVNADNVLTEKSTLWRKARNSLSCRRMARNGYTSGRSPAPQCFQYFSKCSVDGCINVETAKKPHSHRCTKCYYFHFCSDACKDYAETFGLHDCEFTPPDKAAAIKSEMEIYMGLNKKKKISKHEICNFCRTKRVDMPPDKNLLQCTGCESVAYCDKSCQVWDWSEHKGVCKK